MPKKALTITLLFSMLGLVSSYCQMPGVEMHRGAKRIEIPFERQDNFIIVKVVYQGIFPLRFIVDTGAEYTILTKKEIANLLNTTYDREISLMGTDMNSVVKAYIARRVRMDLQNLTLTKDILVLDDDYFKFDQFAGLDVQGIIGAEVFKGYVLKIDYQRQILTLIDPSVFRASEKKKYQELPIEIFRSKPYLFVKTQFHTGNTATLKYLLDTGAALAVLMHTYSSPDIRLPEQIIKGKIGTGLGGSIEGVLGRLNKLYLGDFTIASTICHFQAVDTLRDTSYLNRRNGLIGGDVLSRFNLIIDFAGEKLYITPNTFFKDAFEYDKSGIVFIAGGVNLSQFMVYEVLENTPAAEADIKKGDQLISINRLPARFYSLGAINRILQNKQGKKIRMKIRRDGVMMTKTFRLRNLI
jgi:predicted aspartyl protease